MSSVDVAAVMAGLKGFQRHAVDHVIDRFYGGDPAASGRFLVADETGLGKSIIARGVIARAIEHLQDVDHVDRIDIVYVCSNSDLARQNLRRLNVTGDEAIGMATRLTLLASESRRLQEKSKDGGKKVNLVSFTPGTSFREGGQRQGSAPERAMLTIILDQLVGHSASDQRTHRLLMQGTVGSLSRFDNHYVKSMKNGLAGEPDPRIVATFEKAIRENGALDRFLQLRDDARGRKRLDDGLRHRAANTTEMLRRDLAKAGVDTLEPDLIILDEFQRFRNLLADPETGGPAAELAHSLFDHRDAKVLLLSATPYKPFTNGDDDEDHYRDFIETVSFLAGRKPGATAAVEGALADYRQSLVVEGDAASASARVRAALTPLMSRSERPALSAGEDMLATLPLSGGVPTPDDLAGWAALSRLGDIAGAPIPLEYWKSIPHFATFMDGYKTSGRVKEMLLGERATDVEQLLGAGHVIDRDDLERFAPIDLANGYLRSLAAQTLDAGWWKLLWLPPTMPYLEPRGVYAGVSAADTTKHVIFSAWSGVPTAVASLLSYEADRRIAQQSDLLNENTAEGRKNVRLRLQYRVARDGQPAAMSTLSLFWPHPVLADAGDPLAASRREGRVLGARELSELLGPALGGDDTGQAWESYFSVAGALPASLIDSDTATLFEASTAGEDSDDGDDGDDVASGLALHVYTARDRMSSPTGSRHAALPLLAAHAPGNIAYRALKSVASASATDAGLWRAAWTLSSGIRALFNRRETIALLVALQQDDQPYWRTVLDYCADGNLQAVLDEYLFQLRSEHGGAPLEDEGLLSVATTASAAIGLRPARYAGHDATRERGEIAFQARFALRYGGKHATDANEAAGERQGEVRNAFNSPFAPFVLASTSVGQEGIDFHWWSHSVIHWNLPSNPVDFEQREGRVNRFAGHAVRKNVAGAHWPDVLASHAPSPWDAAFDAAGEVDAGLGEFSPWWVYPGAARIHRVIAAYPLSRDIDRYARLRDALTLYRLTLGQPRQEDMVELMRKRGVDARDAAAIDLRPPVPSSSRSKES
ncbi:helicase-related protein [Planococcus sp. APC 4015]|nr:helicase-related protein [Planococcus sp. APC 4015]